MAKIISRYIFILILAFPLFSLGQINHRIDTSIAIKEINRIDKDMHTADPRTDIERYDSLRGELEGWYMGFFRDTTTFNDIKAFNVFHVNAMGDIQEISLSGWEGGSNHPMSAHFRYRTANNKIKFFDSKNDFDYNLESIIHSTPNIYLVFGFNVGCETCYYYSAGFLKIDEEELVYSEVVSFESRGDADLNYDEKNKKLTYSYSLPDSAKKTSGEVIINEKLIKDLEFTDDFFENK